MNFLITLLTIIEVIVCLLLSLLVLMQRPRQEGLGAAFGSGVTDQMFGAQTTNVLQKATVYLGVALFGLTFLLAILTSRQDEHRGKATFVEPTDKAAKPATGKEGAAPGSPEDIIRKKIEEEIGKKAGENKTATPPASTTPAPAKPAEKKPAAPAPAPASSATPPAAQKPATPTPAPAPAAPAPAK